MPKEPNLYKRGKVWYVKIERGGNSIHESTGEVTISGAREYRERALAKLKRIKNGLREDLLYDDVMLEFLKDCETRLKSGAVKRYKVSARAVHPYFTGRKLVDIKKADIVRCLSDRKRELTGSGANRDRALLSSMFTFACDRDYVEFNPVLAVKKYREAEPRTRNFTKDEYKAILKQCHPLLANMVEFTIETGCRASEVIFLRHDQLDLKKHQVTFTETKSGKARIVPLSDKAIECVASQIRHISSPYVFWHGDGLPYKNAPRAFVEACTEAKVADCVFHDLRRTFTCWHYSKGVALEKLSQLLGHSTYAITQAHYAFLQQEDLHEVIRGVAKSSQARGTSGVSKSLTKSGKGRKC